MNVVLRDYQESLVNKTWAALAKPKNKSKVLLQAPTGAGKTAMGTKFVEEVVALDQRAFFIVHRQELVHQTSLTFTKYGVPHSFIAAGRKYDPSALVQICSIDTLKGRIGKLDGMPDLVLWDECHHLGAAGWTRVMQQMEGSQHIGLSATPCRQNGEGLDKHFSELIPGPSTAWLMEHSHLAQYRAYAPSQPNLSTVHSSMGDYKASELENVMAKSGLTGDAVQHWKQFAKGLRTIVFAVSVKHSKSIIAEFNAAGIPAAHLDGDTPKADRAEIIRKYADGELMVLSNVSLFGEGFDLSAVAGKDVTIDCVMLMRPTQSLGLFLQQVGRVLRPAARKLAIILDHAGNIQRHGLPDDIREWTLKGKTKGEKEGNDGPPPPATCTGCFSQIRRPCPRLCPHCGSELSIPKELPKVSREMLREIKKGEREAAAAAKAKEKEAKALAKIEAEAARKAKRAAQILEERACKTLEDLIQLGKERGYKYPSGWASQRFTTRRFL